MAGMLRANGRIRDGEGMDRGSGEIGIWRNRNYRLIWSAASVSAFGTQITLLALPLLAAVTLHASPLEMGILAAAQNSAVPVFGLFAGCWPTAGGASR